MAKKKRIKSKPSDFSFSGLPDTRRKQFFDCLRNRWGLFLKVGVIFAFLSLLIVALIYARDLVMHNVSNNESLDEVAKKSQLATMSTTFASLIAVSIAIFCLPLGGILRIYRSLIYDEGVFFFSDFKKGFKETWKVSLVIGILLGGGYFASAFYKEIIDISYLSYAPYGILIFLVFPWAFTTLSYASIYSSSFKVIIQNGFVLTVKSFLKALLFVLLSVLPLLFLFIPSSVYRYVALVLCFLLYYPLVLFAFYLMDIALFDMEINSKMDNGLYHKGLYDENIKLDE